jgi:tetratricopeptide (TPR) repeat protein
VTSRLLLSLPLILVTAWAQTLQQAEAFRAAGRYQEANTAFRALVAANPKNPEYRVKWGRLFLERFNKEEAANLFQEALEIHKDYPPALVGLALVAADGFDAKAVELAEKALAADPKLVEAHELLARLALEDNNPKRAVEQADKALAISPQALDAMAVRASIDGLADKADSPWMARALAVNPKYGQAYATAGHFFVLNRRYEEGIRNYRKAIELDPLLWTARAQLGVNLMRLGQEAEARRQLELCYENGHRDAATVNTLRLLDSYKNFVTYKTDNTVLKLHKKEAELLRPYFESELKRAIAAFEKKYQVRLNAPVQVEVYPDHEDFAVRTMGMPGLGALGVTFGNVVAMDSPSGRKPGSFHWASTLWHELSHVFVLSATHHRVPRWFTEGLAVHEETAVSPEWGDRLDPQVIAAIKNKKLLPVTELDRGFIRPSYPNQVVISYFQAGRICDYIKEQWGFAKLLAMMNDFARSEPVAQVIEKELGITAAEFDKRFLAALESETKGLVEGFDDWRKKLKQISDLSKAAKHDEVIPLALAIRDLYKDYVEAGSVYEFLADAYVAKKNNAAAIEELERYARAGGRSPVMLKRLASLLEEAGRKPEAARALERLNFIFPNDADLHNRLGGLWIGEGNALGAIREYSAVLAMKPMDLAASHFNLARAYREAKQLDQAKDQLLLALEAAPGYRPAQKMLLELSR